MDLNLLTIESARTAVQERQTTATALAEAFLQKIEAEDAQVGAYLLTCRERALAKAAEGEAKPISDKRGTKEFRIDVAGVLARRAAKIAYDRAKGLKA